MDSIIVSIGDELLIGQTINTNAGWMGKELNAIGVEAKQVLTISDTRTAIENALEYASANADVVLLTGGLGPTKDDITKKVFAEFFNVPLVMNERALQNVTDFFERYKRPMLPVNKLQGLVPAGCKMLLNKVGTAPGMWMQNEDAIFVSMPGVPSEMKYLMENEVLPRIKKEFDLPAIVHRTMMTEGLGESYIAQEIEDIEDGLPQHIKLAYLPSPGIVKIRLTGRGKNEEDLTEEINTIFAQIESRIQGAVFAHEDIQLEAVIGGLLKERNQTLATAESCTSGALASRVTSIAGSSAYFEGSIVAYSNSVKTNVLNVEQAVLSNHGAVSEATVKQMALGVKTLLNSDFAISTSGIAGPDGGTDEKPVGTVWIALATPKGVFAQQFQMGAGRERVVKKTVRAALGMLHSYLTEQK